MAPKNHYGLLNSEKEQLISILSPNSKIEKIVLFGSRAKGNFQNGSDIDLALFGSNIKLNDILDASIEIDKLQLPYKVDLVIYNRIKEQALIDHIDRIGIVIYESNSN